VIRRLALPCLAVLLSLLLAACTSKGDNIKLDSALFQYAGAIRFSDIERAYEYVHPRLRAEQPMSNLDWNRFAQVQFTGYQVKLKEPAGEGEVRQLVEIRLINRHTQTERVITARELWQWDNETKRWWLMSGLPDISQPG
jgi:hypothetical protein